MSTRYINSKTMTATNKASVVADAGGVSIPPPNSLPSEDKLVVVVNNGPFCAAAVVESERDLRDFTDPSDTRGKIWFSITNAQLADLLEE